MSSHHTNSKWLNAYKARLHLTDTQKSFLIGTILGDGSIKLSVSGKSARLQVCHSNDHKDYVMWKKEIFKAWVLSGPKYYKVKNSLIFRTISHPEIFEFYNKFYVNKIKIIPPDIDSLLKDNLSLAVWFMDDGNGFKKSAGYRLSTYAFGYEGTTLLQKCLLSNFDIKSNLWQDSKGYQIYIPVSGDNGSRFRKIIYKHIIPDMRYKFRDISPVETDSKEEIV